jgi:hypothetical protein
LHLYQRNAKFIARPLGSLFTGAAVQEGALTLVKWSINTGVMACGHGTFTEPDPRIHRGGLHSSLAHAEIQGWGSVGDGENFQRLFDFKNGATKVMERCKVKLCTPMNLSVSTSDVQKIQAHETVPTSDAQNVKGSLTPEMRQPS